MSLSRRSRLWLVIGAALVIAVVLGVRAVRPEVPRVAVARVRLGALESWITTNGIIEPSDPHGIHAPVTAFVTTVPIVEGQKVKRGAPLLTLNVEQQRAELARAREDLAKVLNDLRVLQAGGSATERAQVDSDLRKTDAEIGELRRAREATERLVAKQAATGDELKQTELALIRAEATRDALARKQQELQRNAAVNVEVSRLAAERAREMVALLEGQIRAADVRAPVDGTVYGLSARPGSRVEAGAVLAQVADLQSLQLRALVDEPELASIREGQPVEVSWSAVPNHLWTGRTERVPKNVVSRGDRMVGEVICSVNNDNQQLIPNLDVDVRIRVHFLPRTLIVPRQAVHGDQSGRYVFVVQHRSLERRAVVVDIASATSYSVARGLDEGEHVALPVGVELRDGMGVRVDREVQ